MAALMKPAGATRPCLHQGNPALRETGSQCAIAPSSPAMPCWHGAARSVWNGITSRREDRCRTAMSRASTAACATSCSTRRCSSAWRMPASRSRPRWMTTIGRDHTHRLATRPRRRSPLDWISNGLLRYALRAPLRRPLLQPRSCATKRPGSNPSWWKAAGHVSAGRLTLIDTRRALACRVAYRRNSNRNAPSRTMIRGTKRSRRCPARGLIGNAVRRFSSKSAAVPATVSG